MNLSLLRHSVTFWFAAIRTVAVYVRYGRYCIFCSVRMQYNCIGLKQIPADVT